MDNSDMGHNIVHNIDHNIDQLTTPPANQPANEPTGLEIAVTGMACRFPGANSPADFWKNLYGGVDSLRSFTREQLREAGVDERMLRHPGYVMTRGVLDNVNKKNDVKDFDAASFGFSVQESRVLDPQFKMLLVCSRESLADTGYRPGSFDGPIGVFAGIADNFRWRSMMITQYPEPEVNYNPALLVNRDYTGMWLSYRLGLTGPCLSINSGCSTGLAAVHSACRALIGGECDMALAGAASVVPDQTSGYLCRKGEIYSPTGLCRPFDADANGTVPASGAGVIVLKRLEDAREDGDRIYAIVKGSAINNDGSRRSGFSIPSVRGRAEVMENALNVAEVPPGSIGFVETHGTGTVMGDVVEIEAMNRVFKDHCRMRCPIGSSKPNIGYAGNASGTAGFIKAVMCLHHRLIPPTLNFNAPHPQLEMEKTPFYVNTDLKPFETHEHGVRRASVSAFGIGGTNAHVVLEGLG